MRHGAPRIGLLSVALWATVSGAAHAVLPAPENQRAFAGNGRVQIKWDPITDPGGQFSVYAVYRATEPFDSVEGQTPIGVRGEVWTSGYTDLFVDNGTSYYYAVTVMDLTGGETTEVSSVGPRTPWEETDLQIVSISRTPRYPRYLPLYQLHEVIEPSGFGPYVFTSAHGLGGGQSESTQRWPDPGDTVTYTATVRNRGTNPWSGLLLGIWRVDGEIASQPSQSVDLDPGGVATFDLDQTWDGGLHDVSFAIDVTDDRPDNNALGSASKSVGFLTYVDESRIEEFREGSGDYPLAATDDFLDWLNRHMDRFNAMFAAAGCAKRVHYDLLEVLDDTAADPGIDRTPFAVFPFRFHAGEGPLRTAGYYRPEEDIDFGLLHEMGHQLGLIDLYRLNLGPAQNQATNLGYGAVTGLMNMVAPVLSQHSARAMTHWLHTAHGYYGQYLYEMPAEVHLRLLGVDGLPLEGAQVTMYQMVERPGQGLVITDQVKASGTTGADGVYSLPNVVIDPALVPPVHNGDELRPNPFGYVAVVGTNGLLHFTIEHEGYGDVAWLDITEVNNAYWEGQTDVAEFERNLLLGGEIQTCPLQEMTELNASSWLPRAQVGSIARFDDTAHFHDGQASLRIETDAPADTFVRYPGDRRARWNLGEAEHLVFWAYHENDQNFQLRSPWIRMGNLDGYIDWKPPWSILDTAYGSWTEFRVPLQGDATWERIESGLSSLEQVQYLEIHADTWGAGFVLWLDGVGFTPAGPGEVAHVVLSGIDPTIVGWDAEPLAESYDVSRGLLTGLGPGEYGACVADDRSETWLEDGSVPPRGDGYFYLVRAVDEPCGGNGSLGTDSTGMERVNTDPGACP